MKKRQWYVLIPVLAAVSLLAVLLLAGSAMSRPTFGGTCNSCHPASASTTISVGTQSETATDITYRVSGSSSGSATGWGVFSGGTKVASGSGAGQFTVARDGTGYTVYWVDSGAGYASTSVTAPMPTTTTTVPPSTTTTTAAPATTSTTVPPATTSTTAPPSTTTTTAPPATTSTTVPQTTGTTIVAETTGTTLNDDDDEPEDDECTRDRDEVRKGDRGDDRSVGRGGRSDRDRRSDDRHYSEA